MPDVTAARGFGETTLHPLERRARRQYILLLTPALLLLAILFVYPLTGMIARSFYTSAPTLANYREILTNDVYHSVIGLTFRLAAGTTLICVVLGYPVAYLLAHARPRTVRLLMIAVILPYFTSVIVRTFAWIVLMGRQGIINQYLTALKVTNGPIDLLYNEFAVLVGMSYVLLPFLVLTLYTVMRGIDQGLIRAAYSLGASRFFAFRRVFLPLSLPGLAGGILLVFILALGFFITPALMGGPTELTVPMLIEREVEITMNWSFASALATALLLVTLVAFAAYSWIIKLDHFLESW
jgi:putative spermidine/putrescine transport system permease protein